MHFENDFIMRQILMAVEFIRRMMRLCEDQQLEQAAQEVDAFSRRMTGWDARTLAATALIRNRGQYPFDDDLAQPVVGEILSAYAILMEAMGEEEEAQRMGEAAIAVICNTTHAEDIAVERVAGMRLLLDKMREPGPDIQIALASFFACGKEYGLMEDALFKALAGVKGKDRSDLLAWGIERYAGILRERGPENGLPYEERAETLRELEQELCLLRNGGTL